VSDCKPPTKLVKFQDEGVGSGTPGNSLYAPKIVQNAQPHKLDSRHVILNINLSSLGLADILKLLGKMHNAKLRLWVYSAPHYRFIDIRSAVNWQLKIYATTNVNYIRMHCIHLVIQSIR